MITKNSIDEKLVALWQEKGDSSDLALDGRLIEDDKEEIDLGQLLRDAVKDFDPLAETIDEVEVRQQWDTHLRPALTASYQSYLTHQTPAQKTTPPQSRDAQPFTRRSLLRGHRVRRSLLRDDRLAQARHGASRHLIQRACHSQATHSQRHVQIDLRRRDVLMAQQLLDPPQVHTRF